MEEKFLQCPYCMENISILLDTGCEGSVNIIDDCEVCCRPIDLHYKVEDFEVSNFQYQAIEGNEY